MSWRVVEESMCRPPGKIPTAFTVWRCGLCRRWAVTGGNTPSKCVCCQ